MRRNENDAASLAASSVKGIFANIKVIFEQEKTSTPTVQKESVFFFNSE